MCADEGDRRGEGRKRGQRKNLERDAHAKRENAERPESAVLHNGEPRLPACASHGVEKVGEAVLMKCAGRRGARRHGKKRRQSAIPERRCGQENRRRDGADQKPREWEISRPGPATRP